MNKDYKNLVKEKLPDSNCSDHYEIYVECDANDGDCINEEIYVNDLYNDELFFLVLCYLNTSNAFGYPNKNHRNVFGKHVGGYGEGDLWFDWLGDYCCDNDLLLFAGMCDYFCHSIVDLKITHYIQSIKYEVELPSIDKIFDTVDEMVKYMNNLYENNN